MKIAVNAVGGLYSTNIGHLQVVFEGNEIEVQSKNNPTNFFGVEDPNNGDWDVLGPDGRSHAANTAGYGNTDLYASVDFGSVTGQSDVELWEALSAITAAIRDLGTIQYKNNLVENDAGDIVVSEEGTQNSNTFINTLLYVVGIDVNQYLPSLFNGNVVEVTPGSTNNLLFERIDGGPASLTFTGSAGDDFFQVGDGDDSIDGGAGSDTLHGNRGSDTLFGGNDDDTIYGDVKGSTDPDDAFDDSLCGGAGIDEIFGGGGDDTICGEDGEDEIKGQAGEDIIDGGAGDDVIEGGSGNDTIDVGTDGGTAYGQSDNDTMYGGADGGILFGGSGGDTMHGAADAVVFSQLYGGSGDDTLYGNGISVLYGGSDNDTFHAQAGDTIADGEMGDTLVYNGQVLTGNDFAINASFQGALYTVFEDPDLYHTFGTVDGVSGSPSFAMVVLGYDTQDAEPEDYGTFSGISFSVVILPDPDTTIHPFAYNIAGPGEDIVLDFTGVDHIFIEDFNFGDFGIGIYNPEISPFPLVDPWPNEGGSFNEIEFGTNTSLTEEQVLQEETFEYVNELFEDSEFFGTGTGTGFEGGDQENETFENLTTPTIVFAGGGGDTVIGSGGGDTVLGETGNDSIFGGDGDDHLYGGTPGFGQIQLETLGLETATNDGSDSISGGLGDDRIFGGSGNDELAGDEGNDSLFGEDGSDILHGGEAADILSGGSGQDQLFGGNGNDSIVGGYSSDTMFGGAGDDILVDTDDFTTNVLNGDAGNDTLLAGLGDDILDGGIGDDLLKGGVGDDQYLYSLGDGIDTILDTGPNAYQDTDRLVFTDIQSSEATVVWLNYDLVVYLPDGGSVTITDQYNTATAAALNADIEFIDFSDGVFINVDSLALDQQFIGTAFDDSLVGGSGDDYIPGNDGNDYLDGGVDNDSIEGGAGDDVIIEQQGLDTYDGGSGSDTLNSFSQNFDTTFDLATGVLDYDGGLFVQSAINFENAITGGGDDIVSGTSGNNSISTNDGDDFISGLGGKDTLVGSFGNDVLYGGAGDDSLDGGSGIDELYGGAGDDVVRAGFGVDTFDGGAGCDTLDISYTVAATSVEFDLAVGTLSFDGGALIETATAFENAIGGASSDTFIGTVDENTFQGNTGNDTLTLGGSADRVVFVDGDDIDTITDFDVTEDVIGLNGEVFDPTNLAAGVTVTQVGADVEIAYGTGDLIVLQNVDLAAWQALYGLSGDGTITGTSGDDVIDAAFSDDPEGDAVTDDGQVINAGDGDDDIYDGAGDDSVFGGAGNDQFFAGGGADHYDGGAGNGDVVHYDGATSGLTIDLADTSNSTGIATGDSYVGIDRLYGTDFADTIIGNGSISFLAGGGGDDHITDGAGKTYMRGNAGADTFRFVSDDDSDRIYDFELHVDTLDVSTWGVTDISQLTFEVNSSKLKITYGSEEIVLDGMASENGNFVSSDFVFAPDTGPTGDGTISGTSGDDLIDAAFSGDPEGDAVTDDGQVIHAGEGDDDIFDGAGDDIVYGGDGNDSFYAGAGADHYDGGGGNGNFVYYNGATSGLTIDLADTSDSTGIATGDSYVGIDRLYGTDFADTIIGDGSIDFLAGGGGDDHITDGAGKNYMRGNAGADTFHFVSDGDSDRVYDFELHFDTLDVSAWGVTDVSQLTFAVNGTKLEITYGSEEVVLDGLASENGNFVASDFAFAPNTGPTGDGTITGTSGHDIIDLAYSGDPDGDAVTDDGQVINAGDGDDDIYDGAGDDSVFGGAGNDQFFAGDGADHYDGGADNGDFVHYDGATSGLTIVLADTSSSTGIATGDSYVGIDRLYGTDFSDTIIGDGSIDFLAGGGGDDHITDGAGKTYMRGNAGADTFYFVSDGDSDRIYDFELHVDTLDVSAWDVTDISQLIFAVNGTKLEITYGSEEIVLDGMASENGNFVASDFEFA